MNFGKNGFGLSSNDKYSKEVVVEHLEKVLAVMGAFVSSDSEIYEKKSLIPVAGLIYSTALPQEIMQQLVKLLKKCLNLVIYEKKNTEIPFLRNELNKINISTSNSNSHIIPIILGDEKILQIAKLFT